MSYLTFIFPSVAGHDDVSGTNLYWYLMIAGACCLVLDQFFSKVIARKNYQGEVSHFNKLTQIELQALAANIGLTKDDRLNVYIHEKGVFILVARVAENTKYAESRGRPYPDDEGVISKAFNSGFCYEQIPHDPSGNIAGYISYMKDKFNMKEQAISQITMKSMAYAAIPVYGSKGNKVAVILMESMKPDFSHLKDVTLPNGSNSTPTIFDENKIQRLLQREANRLSLYHKGYYPNTTLIEGY